MVGDALRLPELRRGVPEVLAHEDGLGAEIRWVHAGEAPNIASLLKGGELLLTTGMAIGPTAAAQRRLAEELAERGIAALVLELGSSFAEAPPALVRAAEDSRLCLVALHRQVRFVEVTEAVHRLLIDQGGEMLRSADQLHRRFTALMLGGAGVPEILVELARFVANPVFLERAGQGPTTLHIRGTTRPCSRPGRRSPVGSRRRRRASRSGCRWAATRAGAGW